MLTVDDLLKESMDKPVIYNKISQILYRDFNIKSAETTLVVLHVFGELSKDILNAKYGTLANKVNVDADAIYADTDSIKVKKEVSDDRIN